MAFERFAALSNRGRSGEARVRGGLHERQGVRGGRVHPAVRRSRTRPRASVVQHGDLRQPREGGRSPKAPEERSVTLWTARRTGEHASRTTGTASATTVAARPPLGTGQGGAMKSKNAVKRSRSESAKPTREDLLVRILELVKKKPGIRPSEINRALNLEQSDDLRQALIDRGLVRKTKEGREVHLYPR